MGGILRLLVVSALTGVSLATLTVSPASAKDFDFDVTVPQAYVTEDERSSDYGKFWVTWPATAGQLLSDGAVAANPDYAMWPRADGVPIDYGMSRWDDLNPYQYNTWPGSNLWLQGNWNAAPGVDVPAAMTEVANCVASAEVEKIQAMIANEAADRNAPEPTSQAEYDAWVAASHERYVAAEKIGFGCVVLAEQYFPHNIYRSLGSETPDAYDTWAVGAQRFDSMGLPVSATGSDGVEYQYQIHGEGYVSELPESNEATMTLMRWNCTQTLNLEQIYLANGINDVNNSGLTEGLDLCTDGLTISTFSQTVEASPALRAVEAPKTEREKLIRSLGPLGFLIPALDPTTFSNLAPYEGWQQEAPRLATAGAVALAFTALAALPSQLLSTTLLENRAVFDKWFGAARRRPKDARASATPESGTPSTSGKRPALPRRSWGQRILKPRGFFAFLLFLVAPVVAAYSQPDFSLDLNHIRIVLWLLIGYVIVNLLSTVIGRWAGGPTRHQFALRATARIDFLLVLIVSVAFTRLTGILPAIVFGAVLALDLIPTGGSPEAEKRFAARITVGSTVYVFAIGLLAWIAFSKYPPLLDVLVYPGLDAPVRELFSVIAIEALATAPLVLLPVAFLPGQSVWNRSKVLWAAMYLIAVALFFWVVVRMPQSWTALPVDAVVGWSISLALYAAFAVGVWGLFRFLHRQRA